MSDIGKFQFNGREANAPATVAVPVTKSGSAMLLTTSGSGNIEQARALYVGGSGHVNVTTINGSECAFYNFPGGRILPVMGITHVLSATTTASHFVALI